MGSSDANTGPVTVRAAAASDAEPVARLIVACWQETYAGLIPSEYLAAMAVDETAERWRSAIRSGGVLVAESDEVVGVGFSGPRRTRMESYEGEFFALYVAGEHQGRGIGRRLMAAMSRGLLDQGVSRAFLWCLRDNPSRWFYERLGGHVVAQRVERFAGVDLDELAYGWLDLETLAQYPRGIGR